LNPPNPPSGYASVSDIVILRGFGKEFGEKYFTTDQIIISCALCDVKVTAEKRSVVEQRSNAARHIKLRKSSTATLPKT
jgi:hypothetical protein